MSATKRGQLPPLSDDSLPSFDSDLNACYGHETVGTRFVQLGMVGPKLTIFGFGTHTDGRPVAQDFVQPDGKLCVPIAGVGIEHRCRALMALALFWLNQQMNGAGWTSVLDFYAKARNVELGMEDVFIALTELFDNCWRDGRSLAPDSPFRPFARHVFDMMQSLAADRVEDGAQIARRTATVDSSPRTLMVMWALRQQAQDPTFCYGRLLEIMLAYYATIYREEYRVEGASSNLVTQLTNVEPWHGTICAPGRAAANAYVRRAYCSSAPVATTTGPMSRKRRWSQQRCLACADCDAGRHTIRRREDGPVPYFVGQAHNSRDRLLEFRDMTPLPVQSGGGADAGTDPNPNPDSDPDSDTTTILHLFPAGGAGSDFFMGGALSGCTIGALAAGAKPQRLVMVGAGGVLLPLPKEEEERARYCVSFHPLYARHDGTGRVQLVKHPFSVGVNEPFVIDDIMARAQYVGCAGLALNALKGTADGKTAAEQSWALATL